MVGAACATLKLFRCLCFCYCCELVVRSQISSQYSGLGKMSRPALNAVSGKGKRLRTWVAECSWGKFPESSEFASAWQKLQAKVVADYADYQLGVNTPANSFLDFCVIVHMDAPREQGSVKGTLATLFKHAGMDVQINDLVSFNGYYRLLLCFDDGVAPEPQSPVQAPDSEAYAELDAKGEADFDAATSRQDLEAVYASYWARREAFALALPVTPVPVRRELNVIQWLNGQPPNIDLTVDRHLSNPQKVQWTLLLMTAEDPDEYTPWNRNMYISDFVRFMTHYDRISPMKDAIKKCDEAAEAFVGFLMWSGNPDTKAPTEEPNYLILVDGEPVRKKPRTKPTKDGLKAACKELWRAHRMEDKPVIPGMCYECGRVVPLGMEGEIQTNLGKFVPRSSADDPSTYYISDASKHGIFCRLACVHDRCKGCGTKLVDDKCGKCDHDQQRNRRKGTCIGWGIPDHNEVISGNEKVQWDNWKVIDWPFCAAKSSCLLHRCKGHVCVRDCRHKCTRECFVSTLPNYKGSCRCKVPE